MLTAAAICPHPPLLIPEATGGTGDAAVTALRDACEAAVATLTGADLLVVVGGGDRTVRFPDDAAGSLIAYGVPFAIGDGPPALPLSLTVGRWLLGSSGQGTVWQAVTADAAPDDCLLLGAALAGLAPRVAMLAIGDGPGRRARRAPGAVDADADRYDKQVIGALASGNAGALADLEPRHDEELFVAGRAAWQVLAGAALADADPGGTAYAGSVRYAAAPFEVSYYVATLLLTGSRA
ncbi:MAG TPA: hypothetical protein VGG16_17135 [Streptosporangiaceae bacterium]